MSEASEGDPVSEWGDDAAVYSSHSELSEWDASDADSVQDPDLFQVTDPTTPGELCTASMLGVAARTPRVLSSIK